MGLVLLTAFVDNTSSWGVCQPLGNYFARSTERIAGTYCSQLAHGHPQRRPQWHHSQRIRNRVTKKVSRCDKPTRPRKEKEENKTQGTPCRDVHARSGLRGYLTCREARSRVRDKKPTPRLRHPH